MATDLNNDPELTDGDAAFLARIRQTYHDYPTRQAPLIRPSRHGRRFTGLPAAAAAAAAVVIGVAAGGVLLLRGESPADQGVADSPAPSDAGSTVSDTSPDASPDTGPGTRTGGEPILVPDMASSWSHQKVDGCAAYEPGPSPEVVQVPRFTAECLRRVSFGSTVIFSGPGSARLGGVDWTASSESWTEIGGVRVFRKVRGEEFTLSGTYVRGIWTSEPREYAVYVGPRAAAALEALTSER